MISIFEKSTESGKNIYRCAFFEDLNLVFLVATFTLAAAVSLWVLLPGAVVELLYLATVPGGPWYRARIANIGRRDYPLLVLMIVGTIIILTFGFGVHRWFHGISHSQSWEFGALFWTGFFALYYWYRMDTTCNQNAFKLAGIIILFLLPVLNIGAGVFLWLDGSGGKYHSLPFHFLHVVCVALIGLALLGTDWMLARSSRTAAQKRALYESVWIADLPIVAAFVVLIGFATLHLWEPCENVDCPDLLLSGAVTFQLIASNILFIVLQFDVLEQVRQASERAAAHATAG